MGEINIISAYLHNRQNCQTTTVYQYNQGMLLKIIGPELPTAYEVDFANSTTGQSITQVGNENGVTIPDQFFVPGSMIHAWIVLTGQDYVVTRYHIMIPISPRAVRTSEEPTPSQQGAIDQAIAALNDGVERAEAAADEAEQAVVDVQETIDTALEEAKASGEFDGPPGPGVAPGGSTGQVLVKKSSADYDTEWTTPDPGGVTDVQVNGTSVVQDGVANVPIASGGAFGAVKIDSSYGIQISANGYLQTSIPSDSQIKSANKIAGTYKPIVPSVQHTSTFYGLAKAAGDSTQSQSSNPVGTYTDEAKAAIQQMLDVPSTSDIPDTSIYATKTDTVLDTTLSMGRKAGTTVGENSVALGKDVEASGFRAFAEGNKTIASGANSHAEGGTTIASGQYSHAEGFKTTASVNATHAEGVQSIASGVGSHAEGNKTQAVGGYSHAEGVSNITNGVASHVEGQQVIAEGDYLHASGRFNVADTPDYLPEWLPNTNYVYRDRVKVTSIVEGETIVTPYTCIYANNDAEFTPSNWIVDNILQYAEIIGNGTADNARSNARALTWEGDERLAGDVYVGCNADSTGGTKLATIEDIPDVPVQDVQVNGVSVVSGGVANVPIGGTSNFGVFKVDAAYGTSSANGVIRTSVASAVGAKNGSNGWNPIAPSVQHYATFYGLAKAAGSDEKNSTLPVGQYTENAKSAISQMLSGPVSVSGSTPTIAALPGIQYVCGEVSTLDITLPASGCVDVVFESGSTPTVLTITPPTGMTMKWANGFDPDNLEANTTYEINIKDGCLGVAGQWT